ncbi:MAG: hypothetical protein METHAR1v1_370020 [Methanothrix sp.]|nr:MAG: hypothetical protein METHAR1v1_370020 [Methanothrix sp.]
MIRTQYNTGAPSLLISAVSELQVDLHQIFGDENLRITPPGVDEEGGDVIGVPGADVGENQHPRPRPLRQIRRLAGGGVHSLDSPVGHTVGERTVVDEKVRPPARLLDLRDRPRIPGVDDLSSRPRRAHHLFRHYNPPSHLHTIPPLEPPEERAGSNAEGYGSIPEETAGPWVLPEAVPEAWDAVGGPHRPDLVPLHPHNVPRLQLQDPHGKSARIVAEPAEELHHLGGSGGTCDGDRLPPPLEGHSLEKPRYPQDVVGVEVGYEDVVEVHHPRLRPHHLPLGPFAAVEEDQLPLTVYQDRRWVPLRGGKGSRSSKKGHSEHLWHHLRIRDEPLGVKGIKRCAGDEPPPEDENGEMTGERDYGAISPPKISASAILLSASVW